MKQGIFFLTCFVALLVPVAVLAGGSTDGLDSVVSSIETRYHVKATRIPFLGLIRFVSRRATEGGVENMRVAEFEHFSIPFDSEELNRLVQERLGPGWERVLRETKRGGASQTLVFMQQEGNRMGLFVLDANGHGLDVVQMSVDPDHLQHKLSLLGPAPHRESD